MSAGGSKKGVGLKMTDAAKVKEGKVGGEDVESEDTERLEPNNRRWWRVCVGRSGRGV